MIYLTTGGNGAGKTLFTLWDVRQAQLAQPDRPVYYHGFRPKQAIIDFGWLPFEPEKWQDLPDGSICIFDECQNELPAKIDGKLPDWVNAIAQHRRRRGFDFWLITPHPSLIHLNVRRLIESPSWHRHMKRTFGHDAVSELRFNFAELKCEQPSAGARGQVTMRSYPKQAYEWYESATKHTGKKQIPKQVFVLAACLVAIPVLGWYAWHSLSARGETVTEKAAIASPAPSNAPMSATPGQAVDPAEYVASFVPRFPGFAHTAPRYDEITKPTISPYPAACVASSKACHCYTQQATRLQVPDDTCRQIVKNGFFVDWETGGPPSEEKRAAGRSDAPDAPLLTSSPAGPAQPPRPAQPGGEADGTMIASLRKS